MSHRPSGHQGFSTGDQEGVLPVGVRNFGSWECHHCETCNATTFTVVGRSWADQAWVIWDSSIDECIDLELAMSIHDSHLPKTFVICTMPNSHDTGHNYHGVRATAKENFRELGQRSKLFST